MHVAHRFMLPTMLSAAIAFGLGAFAQAADNDAGAPADKQLNQLYWQGQQDLKKSDWNAALKHFGDLEQQLRAKEPKSADTALYWKAYTLVQAKRTSEAKAAVERLHRDFPDSRWSNDADALLRQTQPAMQRNAQADDEGIAEIAVEGLMNAPPERAIPLLKKVLQSQHSNEVKKRALFVLSQIDEDAALDAVVEVAKTSNDKALRDDAIRMLGVSGEDRAIKRLRELYTANADAAEKRTIVQAFLTADRKDLILETARNETDPKVRHEAIQALGAMEASKELEQLFESTHDVPNQLAIVQSLGVAGAVQSLSAIAQGKQPDEVRVGAIRALGIAGDRGGAQALVKLYPQLDTPAQRDAVLQGLLIAGDSDAMVQLYRQAKSKEEKQALMRAITAEGGDAALDLIETEVNKK
jgi:HEAT repeat protein